MSRYPKVTDPYAQVFVGCKLANRDRERLRRIAFENGQTLNERIRLLLDHDIVANVGLWRGTRQDMTEGALPGQIKMPWKEPTAAEPSGDRTVFDSRESHEVPDLVEAIEQDASRIDDD